MSAKVYSILIKSERFELERAGKIRVGADSMLYLLQLWNQKTFFYHDELMNSFAILLRQKTRKWKNYKYEKKKGIFRLSFLVFQEADLIQYLYFARKSHLPFSYGISFKLKCCLTKRWIFWKLPKQIIWKKKVRKCFPRVDHFFIRLAENEGLAGAKKFLSTKTCSPTR